MLKFKSLVTAGLAAALFVSVSVNTVSAKHVHQHVHVRITRQAHFTHRHARRHRTRRPSQKALYRLGRRAGRLDLTLPTRFAGDALHSRAFDHGFRDAASKVYRHVNGKRRSRLTARQDANIALRYLDFYHHGSYAYRQGWKMATGDENVRLIHKPAFKAGFRNGVNYYFGRVSNRTMKTFYRDPAAIDKD